jgi:intracellular multiplication protein IcmK
VLEGITPEGGRKLAVDGVDGRSTAYLVNGITYVRTPLTLLSPSWMGSVSSADGMNVYALKNASVLLLSDKGEMVRARLTEKDVANVQ